MHSIYALIDPRTDAVCYVGSTSQSLEKRLCSHISVGSTAYHRRLHQPIYHFINELKVHNMKPRILELEQCPTRIHRLREAYWLQWYINRGIPLLNRYKKLRWKTS